MPRTRPPAEHKPDGDGHRSAAAPPFYRAHARRRAKTQPVLARGPSPRRPSPRRTVLSSFPERPRAAPSGAQRDGPGASRGSRSRQPAPPHRAALEMAARQSGSPLLRAPPHSRGRHTPEPQHPAELGTLRPPRRGAALFSSERGGAGARVEEGGSAAPPPASGRRGRRTRSLLTAGSANKGRRPLARGAATAGGASPRPGGHRDSGDSPPARSPLREPLCLPEVPPLPRRDSPACEPPRGRSRSASDRDAPPPPLATARPPSPRAGATSPLCRRRLARSPLRPAAVPLAPGPAEGQVASPALSPAALLRLQRRSIPAAGKSQRRLPSGRRGHERSGAAGGSGSALRLGLRGWTGLRPAPQPARGEEGGDRPPSPTGRRGTPVKCHGSPSAPRRHPAHRSPREGAVKVAAEAVPAAARPAAARREGAPRQPPGKRPAPSGAVGGGGRGEPAREGRISFAWGGGLEGKMIPASRGSAPPGVGTAGGDSRRDAAQKSPPLPPARAGLVPGPPRGLLEERGRRFPPGSGGW